MAKEGYMTGSQLRQYLHISTRKLKYLMDNDYIPHENNGQDTHKYLIRIEDAEAFNDRQHTDKKLIRELTGLFTSRKEHHPIPLIDITDETCGEFKAYLEDLFKAEPEAISVVRICELAALKTQSIHRLISCGTVYGTKAKGKIYCSKSELIDYLATEDMLRNPTCEGYKDLVRAFKRRKSNDAYNEKRRKRRQFEREKRDTDT